MSKLTDDEKRLARIERAWADCAVGFRTGIRVNRHHRIKKTKTRKANGIEVTENIEVVGLSIRAQPLENVHAALEVYRNIWEKGQGTGLLNALKLCAEENLPAPYWAAETLVRIVDEVSRKNISLHTAFGLDQVLPTSGKKARQSREDLAKGIELYGEVSMLAATERISETAALKRALCDPRFAGRWKQRKAWDVYKEIRDRQNEFLKAQK
ncbi:MAG: hypothetical protein AB7R40_25475 [Nitrospiraceae bacterium]